MSNHRHRSDSAPFSSGVRNAVFPLKTRHRVLRDSPKCQTHARAYPGSDWHSRIVNEVSRSSTQSHGDRQRSQISQHAARPHLGGGTAARHANEYRGTSGFGATNGVRGVGATAIRRQPPAGSGAKIPRRHNAPGSGAFRVIVLRNLMGAQAPAVKTWFLANQNDRR